MSITRPDEPGQKMPAICYSGPELANLIMAAQKVCDETESRKRCGAIPRPSRRGSVGGLNLGDLRAFERQVSEQTFFMKDKAENRLPERCGIVLATRTLRHEGEGGVRAGRPILALGEPAERVGRHEQNDLAVPGDAEREADRGRRDAVVIDGLAVHAQDALAELTRDTRAALGHSPKDQYARCLVGELLVLRIERVEARYSLIGARANLRLGACEGWGARNQSEQCQAGDGHQSL